MNSSFISIHNFESELYTCMQIRVGVFPPISILGLTCLSLACPTYDVCLKKQSMCS